MGYRNEAQTYYEMSNSPDIVNEIVRKKAWGFTKDDAPFVSFLEQLPELEPIQSKKLNFAIGNYYQTSATLGATFNSMTASTITFASDYDFFLEGDILRLFDTGDNIDTTIRITSRITAAQYNCVVLNTNDTGGGTAMAIADTLINVLNSSVNIHGDARQFLNKKGEIGSNWMQRSRDTVGKSDFSGEDVIIDDSMEGLVRMGWRFFAEKDELKLLTQNFALGGQSTSDEFLISGGLPYFYNPAQIAYSVSATTGVRTAAAENFTGVNKVVSGTEFTMSDLRNWMCDLTEYGTKDKLFIVNDDTYKMVYDLVEKNVGIQRTDLRSLDLGLADAWEVNTLSLGFGRAHLLRSKALNNVRMVIKDADSPDTLYSNGEYMICAVDPYHVGRRAYVDRNNNVRRTDMTSVERINNGSIDKMEFDGMTGLEINEPRSGGYFSITNS